MSRSRLAALAALSALPALASLPSAGLARAGDEARLGFGLAAVDALLGGGLVVAALHEFYGAVAADAPAVAAVALLLAIRNGRDGPILWIGEDRARREGRLYGLGLAELGIDPGRVLLVEAPDTLAVLRAGADSVACSGVAAVILAPHGKATAMDLTATRRLGLAAARSGVTTLVVRHGDPAPSAAQSRWLVSAAASTRLAGDAPGLPAFHLALLRHRGGVAGFSCVLEWDRDCKSFAAADPGAAPAAAFERAGAAPGRRHAA